MKVQHLIVILLLVSIINGHKDCHFKQTPKDRSILQRREEDPERHLQGINPQRMRIKYDVTSLTTINEEPMKDFLAKTVEVTAQYFSDLIQVKRPLTSPIKIKERNCKDNYMFSEQQMKLEYEDVDLMIFVTYTYDPNQSYVAYASGCQQDDVTGRNVVGMVNFNSAYVKPKNNYGFQNQLQTTIHELFHVIVFDSSLYEYFIAPDGKSYHEKLYNNKDAILKFPNVAKWVQNYYSCPTSIGMELENNGGPSSALSHWEMSILYDDTMTAAGDDTLWSGVNNALLLDSGWYEVTKNFEDHLTWGRNKGCEFLEKKCNSDKKFNEFCYQDQQEGLTFSFHSTGFCNQTYWEPECKVVLPVGEETKKRKVCYDPDTPTNPAKPLYIKQQNEQFGDDSRAFFSTLKLTSEQIKKSTSCYNQKCSDDKTKIYITFGSETLTCTQTGQKLKSSQQNVEGEITCPNISEFCDKPNECYLQCSQNGYCLGGKCVCLPGFTGKGCECKEGTANVNGNCENCADGCSVCSSSDVNQCSACKYGYVLKGTKCVACKSPCSSCVNSEENCTSCISNYSFDKNKCTIFSSDQNCDVPLNQTQCKTCVKGKGLDSKGKCTLDCDSSCQTCQGKIDTCSSCKEGFILVENKCICQDGYYYDSQNKICKKCSTFCKACKNATTCDQCIETNSIDPKTQNCKKCPIGSFLDQQGNCSKCDTSCKECEEKATNCISCQKDATLTGTIGSQTCPCNQGYTYFNDGYCYICKHGVLNNGVCTCNTGYYLHEYDHVCEECSLGCKNCLSEQCSECSEEYQLNADTKECDSCSEGYEMQENGTCESNSTKLILSFLFVIFMLLI